jgi:hypothetical protein
MKKTIWMAAVMTGVLPGMLKAQDTRALEDQKKLEAYYQRVEAGKEGARGGGARGGAVPEEALKKAIEVTRGAIDTQKVVLNGQTFEFVTGMMQGPLVKNAPYAAEAVTETTQKLFDGNQIVRTSSTKQYRDSEGRERREESMGAILITDPVDKVRLTLRPETKTFEKQPYRVPQVVTYTALGVGKGGAGVAEPGVAVGAPGARRGGGPGAAPLLATRVGGPAPKQEDLGTKIIEGVQAQGTRSTRTIAAGEIGNARPIEVVDERWYSPDLQLAVMTRHSDPREGETVFRLTNIQRIEQVHSLFEVPSDYTAPVAPAGLKLKAKSK